MNGVTECGMTTPNSPTPLEREKEVPTNIENKTKIVEREKKG